MHLLRPGKTRSFASGTCDSAGLADAIRGHSRNVWEVRFSPDGETPGQRQLRRTVRLWDAATGRLLKTLTRPQSRPCVGLDYSPDGTLLATGGDDSTIR